MITGTKEVADITALRQEIDVIDDQILALLQDRMQVVKQVGAWKQAVQPGPCPIRPGREAQQLRRVVGALERSDFLPAAGAAMWRMMIMAALAVEGEMKISVYAPGSQWELFWLAREYFGPFSHMMRHPTPKRVLGDLIDGKAQVGVLPLLEEAHTHGGRWWTELLGDNPPKIFAHVPFTISQRQGREVPFGLAVAYVEPEETGDDVSLLALEADDSISQHRMQLAFAQVGLEVRWIEVFSPSPQVRWHVVEINTFITPEHARYRQFLDQLHGTPLKAVFLGAYAAPIKL